MKEKKFFYIPFAFIWLEFFVLIWIGIGSPQVLANPVSDSPLKNQILNPGKTRVKPHIDGVLGEDIWQTPPLEMDFSSYYPVYGEILPQKTQIWMTYDSNNLYFAFMCHDSEPQQVKTSLTSRDNMYDDDWVGLTLDSLDNKQSAYGFYVNPNGAQGDLLESAHEGQNTSPDFVWESAGKITSKGYQVEIGIPLRSIRFKSGKYVKMGILFRRKISRLGVNASWPALKPGEGVFNFMVGVIYNNLKKQSNIELLPNIIHGSNRHRTQPNQWAETQNFTEVGIGFKYGLTSSITAGITINPDFSQVESDAFQVEVNRRYPLFYSEKRPFFMEGADIFGFFTIPDGYLPHPLHTRRIMDPDWGIKISGALGKSMFGLLAAGDKWPDKNAYFGIARGKYSLTKDSYFGFLYSGRESTGEYNRVIGVDIGYRLFKYQKFNASFLYSMNGIEDNNKIHKTNSSDFNIMSTYNTKQLEITGAFEHIGRDFRMDSSFLKRTGINDGWIGAAYFFYPDAKKLPWLKLIVPEIILSYLHDFNTHMDDGFLLLGVNCNFTKRGYLGTHYVNKKESWQGDTFDLNRFKISAGIQLTKWFLIEGYLQRGETILYEADPSYKGRGVDGWISLVFQPNNNLNQQFNLLHSDLSGNKKRIYDVNIFYSRTTYQFNKYFFLKAVLQYNSYQKRLLTDFLASFTLIPGTVLHVGYGGLYENRKWQDGQWLYRQGELQNIKRSFFFKASYLWRF